MALLKVNNLTYTYSGSSPLYNDAVKDVSFSIEKGEIVGIIGHTGSGKSTLVQQLNGLLKPTSGEVLLDDKNIWDNPKEIRKVRSRVGLVFQYPEYQLFEETVYEDIAFGPKNMGLSGAELDKCVRAACELIGVKEGYFSKSPFELSGGEKRRVAIAGVLAMKPEIIIFDEPTSGLDPKGREDIIKIINDYRNISGATVIIISHNMEDMALIADKLLVMNKGNLAIFDTVENVFAKQDELLAMGLSVPMVTKVIGELSKLGVDIDKNIFTVSDAVEQLRRIKEGDIDA